jgi:hypothetical protein
MIITLVSLVFVTFRDAVAADRRFRPLHHLRLHMDRAIKTPFVATSPSTKFEARIKELLEDLPDLAVLVEPLLVVRRVLREQIGVQHRRLLMRRQSLRP